MFNRNVQAVYEESFYSEFEQTYREKNTLPRVCTVSCSQSFTCFKLFTCDGRRYFFYRLLNSRLSAVSYFSLQSYCKRNPSTQAAIKEGVSPRRKNKKSSFLVWS